MRKNSVKSVIDWQRTVQNAKSIEVNKLQVEIKVLKEKVAKQEKQIQKLTKQLKVVRKAKKIMSSQIKGGTKLKQLSLRTTAKPKKITKLTKSHKLTKALKQRTKQFIQSGGHRTRQEYLEAEKVEFINRLIVRLQESGISFANDGIPESAKFSLIAVELMKKNIVDINTLVKINGLESAYYESEGNWSVEGVNGQEVYENIVPEAQQRLLKALVDFDLDLDEESVYIMKTTELQKELEELRNDLKELRKHMEYRETEEGQKEVKKNLEDFKKYLAEMMRK